jgi:DNA-binding transcriptional MerR regulator
VGVSFSMSDVAKITGLHKNTIRNYIQRGELKGRKVDEGLGKQRWMIEEEELRLCDVPQIAKHFSPKNDRAYLTEQERKEKEYLRRIREQEQRIAELTEELAQARMKHSELEAAASEDKRVIAIYEKNTADLIKVFIEMSEYVSPRVHKRLKDRSNIYLEQITPNHYAINVKDNKIEYKTG